MESLFQFLAANPYILLFLVVGMAVGMGALAAANSAAASLSASLFTGFCASLLLMSTQAALSDLHGRWRAAAIGSAE